MEGITPDSTPEGLMTVAHSVAWELVRVPAKVRDAQLARLKRTNRTFHALVQSALDDIRRA